MTIKRRAFAIAAEGFALFDSVALSRLSPERRQAAYELAFKVKGALFPGQSRSGLATTHRTRALPKVRRADVARLPEWLVEEIGVLRRHVDPTIFAGSEPGIAGYQRWWPHHPAPMRALRRMQEASPSPEFVVLAPWIKRGGADLVVLKHLRAFAARGRTCLVLTEPTRSEWLSRLPGGVEVVDAGSILGDLKYEYDRQLVLARFLMQSGAGTIHVVNSRLGWQTIRGYGKALSQGAALFASLYCDDAVAPDGTVSGYAHEFLPSCAGHLSGVVSDNAAYLSKLGGMYGIGADRLHVAYVSTDAAAEVPPGRGRNVLWAGRLDRQKRPDILLAVAERMPDVRFDVYGGTLLAHDRGVLDRLRRSPNVRMMGAYDGFESLALGDYAAFLYTSSWDGLPNVLLEAGARGMAVVATDLDGICELIDRETGWPADADDAAAHARALERALADPGEASRRAAGLRERVLRRHSEEAFEAALAAIPSYFGTVGNASAPSRVSGPVGAPSP